MSSLLEKDPTQTIFLSQIELMGKTAAADEEPRDELRSLMLDLV